MRPHHGLLHLTFQVMDHGRNFHPPVLSQVLVNFWAQGVEQEKCCRPTAGPFKGRNCQGLRTQQGESAWGRLQEAASRTWPTAALKYWLAGQRSESGLPKPNQLINTRPHTCHSPGAESATPGVSANLLEGGRGNKDIKNRTEILIKAAQPMGKEHCTIRPRRIHLVQHFAPSGNYCRPQF